MNLLHPFIFGLFVATTVALLSDLEEWNAFKLKYEKKYPNATEEKKRMEIFLKNKHKVEEHNEKHSKGLVTFKMGLNDFSDLSVEEVNAKMNGLRPSSSLESEHQYSRWHHHHHQSYRRSETEDLPDSIDWRDEGAVNENKLQGHCGSCWAFSVAGAIEGQYFRKTGNLIRLSEQNLIDCVNNCGCDGCSLHDAFQYVELNGISTEDDYPTPYMAKNGFCTSNSPNSIAILGYNRIPEGDEDQLQEAIATIGPISVSIDASHYSFHLYDGGIYYEPECGTRKGDLNHALLIVGYGSTEEGEAYYIAKNWYGGNWGEGGYIKMPRNQNYCGIASEATYPIL